MPFPEAARVELPILQELEATGGSDQLRYLYDRLVRYFPQLTAEDLDNRSRAGRTAAPRWCIPGRQLTERVRCAARHRWSMTARGRRGYADAYTLTPPQRLLPKLSAQSRISGLNAFEIGPCLAATRSKYEHTVVWRDIAAAPRRATSLQSVSVSRYALTRLTTLRCSAVALF